MTDKGGPEAATQNRLDGWKRIAAYLNRDVRTVRRWEKRAGLPVRRLMHQKQATVYAYRHELDAWLRDKDERATAVATKPRGMPGRNWAWLAIPVLVVSALLAWLWPDPQEPAIAFGEWDWVLVTEFDNRTGEDVLEGTVEYALQRELANSRYVRVVPAERVGDTLRLMQLPPDTRIDTETGREISLRDGDIRILIGGRTEKIGNHYLISADLVNPSDGVSLASFSEEAIGQDGILPAVGDLARSVRSALGEGLASMAESEEMLAKVTTPSLHALRLFSQADQLMASPPERVRALAVLEEAIRIDPEFASAHLLLVYALEDREEFERAAHHMEQAVALADRASERERLFILAKYYDFLDDLENAIETYRLLLSLYPDHYWANGNLSNLLEGLGDLQESERFRVRVAELRPNWISWYPDMTVLRMAIANGHREVRDKYLDRLQSVADAPGYEWAQLFLSLLPVHESWINGEYEAALEHLEGIVDGVDQQALVANGWLFAYIRSAYLALGQLVRFHELTALREQLGWFEVVLDYESGNRESLKRYTQDNKDGFWNAALLALAGKPERAIAVANDPESLRSTEPIMSGPSWKSMALGQAAFAEGRFEDVISIGDDAGFLNITHKWAYLFWVHTVAQAYEHLGETDSAIDTLELAALQKPLTIFETAGTFITFMTCTCEAVRMPPRNGWSLNYVTCCGWPIPTTPS
jgi:tetratricopeptide (TPR) repeat protein